MGAVRRLTAVVRLPTAVVGLPRGVGLGACLSHPLATRCPPVVRPRSAPNAPHGPGVGIGNTSATVSKRGSSHEFKPQNSPKPLVPLKMTTNDQTSHGRHVLGPCGLPPPPPPAPHPPINPSAQTPTDSSGSRPLEGTGASWRCSNSSRGLGAGLWRCTERDADRAHEEAAGGLRWTGQWVKDKPRPPPPAPQTSARLSGDLGGTASGGCRGGPHCFRRG